jgi:hypothetical protein
VLGLVTSIAIGLVLPLGVWVIRREMCRLARAAASKAGLVEMR